MEEHRAPYAFRRAHSKYRLWSDDEDPLNAQALQDANRFSKFALGPVHLLGGGESPVDDEIRNPAKIGPIETVAPSGLDNGKAEAEGALTERRASHVPIGDTLVTVRHDLLGQFEIGRAA